MTALYAIAAVIVIAGIMTGAYLIGLNDGRYWERMEQIERNIAEGWQITPSNPYDPEADIPQQEQRHQLTSADLAQMEQEARNKQEGEWRKQN